ncbi:hypothetical protein ACSMAD_000715 [Cronobacter sakazakii]
MRDIMRFVILIPALMQLVFKTLLPVSERHSVSFYAGQSGFFCNADHKISMLYALLRGRLSAGVTNRKVKRTCRVAGIMSVIGPKSRSLKKEAFITYLIFIFTRRNRTFFSADRPASYRSFF